MACTPSNIPLFPYTTLFRSKRPASASCRQALLRDEFRSTFENPAFVSLGILSDCGPKFYGISKLQFLNKTVRFPPNRWTRAKSREDGKCARIQSHAHGKRQHCLAS